MLRKGGIKLRMFGLGIVTLAQYRGGLQQLAQTVALLQPVQLFSQLFVTIEGLLDYRLLRLGGIDTESLLAIGLQGDRLLQFDADIGKQFIDALTYAIDELIDGGFQL